METEKKKPEKVMNELKNKMIGIFVASVVTMLGTNFLFIATINSTISDLRKSQNEVKQTCEQKIEKLEDKFYAFSVKQK